MMAASRGNGTLQKLHWQGEFAEYSYMLEFCRNAHWTGFVAEPTCIIRSYMAFKDAEIGVCIGHQHRTINAVSNKANFHIFKQLPFGT
jgi:hypothetical protein